MSVCVINSKRISKSHCEHGPDDCATDPSSLMCAQCTHLSFSKWLALSRVCCLFKLSGSFVIDNTMMHLTVTFYIYTFTAISNSGSLQWGRFLKVWCTLFKLGSKTSKMCSLSPGRKKGKAKNRKKTFSQKYALLSTFIYNHMLPLEASRRLQSWTSHWFDQVLFEGCDTFVHQPAGNGNHRSREKIAVKHFRLFRK